MARGEIQPVIKFIKLRKDAILPTYAHPDDAGFDLSSVEGKELKPGKLVIVSLGIASEIPLGWYAEIRDRSGLAFNHGIHTLAGTIDAGYRGEWKLALINQGGKSYKIVKHERVAQGILLSAPQARLVEAKKLSESTRGKRGFGSTGRK